MHLSFTAFANGFVGYSGPTPQVSVSGRRDPFGILELSGRMTSAVSAAMAYRWPNYSSALRLPRREVCRAESILVVVGTGRSNVEIPRRVGCSKSKSDTLPHHLQNMSSNVLRLLSMYNSDLHSFVGVSTPASF